jgi:beta-galactosidase
MQTAYDVPQEHGNRHETRWARILDPRDGSGIEVRFEQKLPEDQTTQKSHLFDFALLKHTAAQLEQAAHPHELPENDFHILRIDASHQGLGSGSCGPRVLDKYELKTQPFEFTVHLKPFQDQLGAHGLATWDFDEPHVGLSPFIQPSM